MTLLRNFIAAFGASIDNNELHPDDQLAALENLLNLAEEIQVNTTDSLPVTRNSKLDLAKFIDDFRESIPKKEQHPSGELKALGLLIEEAKKKHICDISHFLPVTCVPKLGLDGVVADTGHSRKYVIELIKAYIKSQKQKLETRLNDLFRDEGEDEDEDEDDEILQLLRDDERLRLFELLQTHTPSEVVRKFPGRYSMPMTKDFKWYRNLIRRLEEMVREVDGEGHGDGHEHRDGDGGGRGRGANKSGNRRR